MNRAKQMGSTAEAGQGIHSARKVTRLHGELYKALAEEAQHLGIRPATLAAHILQTQTEKCKSGLEIHPLTTAYLPTHNPRIAKAEKAKTVTITAPETVFADITRLAQDMAKKEGYKNNGSDVDLRRYNSAVTSWVRTIQTSMIVEYLDKYEVI